ncbi:activating signal cointegrator 1 complex subunit 3-like [Onthophagus taurus]|uniref:activating signal cointegrator 1 complex subunit 3-like n=1 Tax=Onthophagus taurus TaxID=166361 RepID=UPI0039BE6296
MMGDCKMMSNRKRFCHQLSGNVEKFDGNLIKSKAAYMVECIKCFLAQKGNFHSLELLHNIESSINLSSHDDRKNIAVMFLLTTTRDKTMKMNDPKIKQLFESFSFQHLQNLFNMAEQLRNDLPKNLLDYVLGKSNNVKEWKGYNYVTESLSNHCNEIPSYFFAKMQKIDDTKKSSKADHSFSMAYQDDQKKDLNVNDNWLEMAHEKYESILPGFSKEDFCKSMFHILASQRSDNELQNELFEMLGFDAFGLISDMLSNRNKIINCGLDLSKINAKPTTMLENDFKRQKKSTPVVTSQVTVELESEKANKKMMRKLEKKMEKNKDYYETQEEEKKVSESESLTKMIRSAAALQHRQYPHVHDSQRDVHIKTMVCGQLTNIPHDAIKKSNQTYDEITLPPPNKSSEQPIKFVDRIQVSTMDKIGKMVFKDIDSFNHIQSEVYPIAYHTNENMLICAPTGAGKTNIALLTIVQQIKNFLENDVVRLDRFKIVYVCPMKALANEMTMNFSKKLMPLGIQVKELTGDMQLTRKEIVETQMLITTPEKWDVITRKGTTDAELTSLLKLLILDEVHLLNSDRGPVIEALVARTLRQVVNSQNMIRIVGLSATLPNYIDVAHFLRVNPEVGLFYFDLRYRSVPLTQTFVGIKSTKQVQINLDTDETCFNKVIEFLRGGHQVMVFVHARNQTNKTALTLKEMATKRNLINLFEPDDSMKAKRALASVKNKSLENLLPYGLGVHHAGMLRKDRNEVERCFLQGAIKVLVCTATLAWGVNLPAHGVIIKGTKLYDSKKGAFVDLDILDVMQIFGRAGRPQFDKSGTGIIITTHDKMHFYLSSMTNQIPIESKLLNALTDNLNAEIVLGSISNIQEAVEWMTFTYLYRRMRINPLVYGLQYSDLEDDPDLRGSMLNYAHKAAQLLDRAHMIRYDPKNGDLTSTNLGRTASYYYINFDTIEVFNETINPTMTEADIITMMCLASEFHQIQVRQEELEDLEQLMETYCEFSVPGGSENVHGKVNILMQTYLSRGYIKSLSLASDMEYITQSAARIARSLFDIAIHQNNALLAGRCLLVAQMFEQQIWPFQSALRQFKYLEGPVIGNIEQYGLTIDRIRDSDEKQIAQLIRNVKSASKVKHCADSFPSVDVESTLQPITRGVIRVKLFVKPSFKWSNTYHGKTSENFWIWVEDPDNDTIYHTESVSVTKAIVVKEDVIELVFTIPLIEPRPSQYLIRISSDKWMGAVYTHPLSFLDLKLPESYTPHTDLLELQPLEITCLNNPKYESLYPFTHFNPVQTQIFHCLYHTDNNVLLGAPTGSGKTIAAEVCIYRLFNNKPELKVVYIAPLKALVRERVDDWKRKFERILGKTVVEMTGDVTPSPQTIAAAQVIITTPEKWDGMSRGWQNRHFIRDVGLMVIDEIHLLGEDRGPVLEVIVSRTNFISDRTGRKIRIIGLSTALANAKDLATWLGIGEMGLYNFRPSVRPVPLEVHISGFPGKHYCPRMISMNRPTYQAIRQHAPDSPALIFCSSRKQTRLTAFDLITYLVTDSDPKQWIHCDDDAISAIVSNIIDVDLKQFLTFGIGIHHAGLQERDRKTVEELFVNQRIQVLIATATLAWGVNFPAHLVVIKGTEYFDGAIKRYVDMPITDVLQMMGRAGRPQFDTSGVACVFVHDIKKNFYKKFLYEPFPVESNLLQVLPDHVNAEIAAETVPTKMNLMEYLTWTYLFRRLLENPSYYNLQDVEPERVNSYLSELVDAVINVLIQSNCVEVSTGDSGIHYESTFYGQIASYYYLSHKTVLHFQNTLKHDSSIMELLNVMCNAEEYSLFPVRHNEDKINIELIKLHSIKANGLAYDSPYLKVKILIEMYLNDFELPNQEYTVDLKSVLDQALRILQAMIDVASNNGWLSCSLRIIHVMQMIIQGRWIYEPDVLTIPGITKSNLSALMKEFNKDGRLRSTENLAGLKFLEIRHSKGLEEALINVFGSKKSREVIKSIQNVPWIDINVNISNADDALDAKIDDEKDLIDVFPGKEFEVKVHINKKGFGKDKSVLQSSKFPKKKDEGWFMILAETTGDELIDIKRFNVHRKCSVSLKFESPSKLGTYRYALYLMSDSYVGLDQQIDFKIRVIC